MVTWVLGNHGLHGRQCMHCVCVCVCVCTCIFWPSISRLRHTSAAQPATPIAVLCLLDINLIRGSSNALTLRAADSSSLAHLALCQTWAGRGLCADGSYICREWYSTYPCYDSLRTHARTHTHKYTHTHIYICVMRGVTVGVLRAAVQVRAHTQAIIRPCNPMRVCE